ncbi:hypothetical protein [Ruegeria marina]|uniref:Tetratricopeptide repeat-containing protein n=1 Tax=Ruegeria marina TaxID=639004 RepID=A0A1G7B9J2_9RHOB|nr:hypothetical protein [Ruegeria marina]SDE23683.1 hypothetical protein SAMN04488239_11623 [Ruegeria marina]
MIARNSAFAYKGSHKDVRQIAAEPGVLQVVEGPVRRGDDRLELSHVALGVLLALAVREQDAADALDKAEALNPHNAVLHFGRCHACLFQQQPDCDWLERAARTALCLKSKDPIACGSGSSLAIPSRSAT